MQLLSQKNALTSLLRTVKSKYYTFNIDATPVIDSFNRNIGSFIKLQSLNRNAPSTTLFWNYIICNQNGKIAVI